MSKLSRLIALLLCAAIPAGLTGCVMSAQAADLMDGVTKEKTEIREPDSRFSSAYMEFALGLAKNSVGSGESSLVSPLSVLMALAMTANGASGETAEQMYSVLGGLDKGELNAYLASYIASLDGGEKARLTAANSIWFNNSGELSVKPEFLQTNANVFGAAARSLAFDDSALKAINSWVKENTEGMIDKIIDSISSEDMMYLVNALAFDAEWQTVYDKEDVGSGTFRAADGTEQKVKMMYSTETNYLAVGGGTGFMKYYSGGRYAFAALLPAEGTTAESYLVSLTGEELLDALASPKFAHVDAAMPKFSSEYDVTLNDALTAMGMPDAFDRDKADFSALGESSGGNLYIGGVLHKTYIAVDELGTKAGAVTAVAVCGSALITESYTVTLDRPFVYMIVDTQTNTPVFIGIQNKI